jgi:hypothetical protein
VRPAGFVVRHRRAAIWSGQGRTSDRLGAGGGA